MFFIGIIRLSSSYDWRQRRIANISLSTIGLVWAYFVITRNINTTPFSDFIGKIIISKINLIMLGGLVSYFIYVKFFVKFCERNILYKDAKLDYYLLNSIMEGNFPITITNESFEHFKKVKRLCEAGYISGINSCRNDEIQLKGAEISSLGLQYLAHIESELENKGLS